MERIRPGLIYADTDRFARSHRLARFDRLDITSEAMSEGRPLLMEEIGGMIVAL